MLSILAIGLAMILSRPISNFLIEVPEQRGVKDDLKESALEGLVRAVAILAASVLVRQISRRRR